MDPFQRDATNQPPPLVGHDTVAGDVALVEAVRALSDDADTAMAVCLQAALLLQHGHPAVADAFCASRVGGDWAGTFGTLPGGTDVAAVVGRTTPVV